jgi:hypothetical protein
MAYLFEVVNKLHSSVFSPFSDEVAAIHRTSQWCSLPPLFLRTSEVHFFQQKRFVGDKK